jgi:hypothetical protein
VSVLVDMNFNARIEDVVRSLKKISIAAALAGVLFVVTRVCLQLGELYARTDQNQTQNTSTGVALGIPKSANV